MIVSVTTTSTAPESPPFEPRRRGRDELRDLRTTLLVVGAVVAVAVIATVVGLLTYSSGGAPAGDIQVTTVDFAIHMPTTLDAGKHTIGLTNAGKQPHEVVVVRTDLGAADLPLDANGDVNEDAPQLSSVADSGNALASGKSKSFSTAALAPGHYVAFCNLAGHYRLGMHVDLTVK